MSKTASRSLAPLPRPVVQPKVVKERPESQLFADMEALQIGMLPYVLMALYTLFASIDSPLTDLKKQAILYALSKRMKGKIDLKKWASLFDAAQQGKLRQEYFVRKLIHLFPASPEFFEQVIDDLMSIALVDAAMSDDELEQLHRIALLFGFSKEWFHVQLRSRTIPGYHDPYLLLNVSKDVDEKELKHAYRHAVRTCHPDSWAGQNISEERAILLRDHFNALTAAYEMIKVRKKFRVRLSECA